MIEDSEERKRDLAFELQNLHIFEKCSKDTTFQQTTMARS